ncbi:class F sortase [Streptacidiphilus sp. MAP12-16]|uniref:class F sortase n=1 Tax=Streptacidiphilus sp. MAP12-16 TaxID=3156300 RepID=UPI003515D376
MTENRPKASGLTALSVIAALAVGSWLLVDGTHTVMPPQPSGADAFQGAPYTEGDPWSPSAERSPAPPPPPPLAPSVPLRIRIPTIGVNAPLAQLGLDSTGHLQVPPENDRNLAGWYRGGPTPGAVGNALIDGHVDNARGRAVFYDLGALHKGNTIEIDRRDGTVAVFGIDAIEVYDKSTFPDQKVYGPTTGPQLRVITCGGGFSKGRGYLGNVVVYAHLTQERVGAA